MKKKIEDIENIFNKELWSLKGTLKTKNVIHGKKSNEIHFHSPLFPKDLNLRLIVTVDNNYEILKANILFISGKRERSASYERENLDSLITALNDFVLNKTESLLEEFLDKRKIDCEGLNKLKDFIISNLRFIDKDNIRVKYEVGTSGDEFREIGCFLHIPNGNEDDIEIFLSNKVGDLINYTINWSRKGWDNKNSINSNVKYYIREDKFVFLGNSNLKEDNFEYLFNEIDGELYSSDQNLLLMNESNLIIENILDTPREKFNVLSREFLKNIKIDFNLLRDNYNLLSFYVKSMNKYVSKLDDNLSEMKKIIEGLEDKNLKILFKDNYKMCEKIYEKHSHENYSLMKILNKKTDQKIKEALEEKLRA